jgi:hypothetical protein
VTIFDRIADWLGRTDRPGRYAGLTRSEKFAALANHGWALKQAREIVAEVEAERADAQLGERKPE